MEEIHEAVDYGVVKMNIDTDTQYAFTRAIADHMFKNYSGVLKVDGEVGNKKNYDPRSYLTIGRGRPGGKGEAGGPGAAGGRDQPLSGLVHVFTRTRTNDFVNTKTRRGGWIGENGRHEGGNRGLRARGLCGVCHGSAGVDDLQQR